MHSVQSFFSSVHGGSMNDSIFKNTIILKTKCSPTIAILTIHGDFTELPGAKLITPAFILRTKGHFDATDEKRVEKYLFLNLS